MSVSDPLIKELKGYTRRFTENRADITDKTEELTLFCRCLEKCFQRGVSIQMNPMGIPNFPDALQWMKDISRRREDSLISYTSIVETVLENQKVQESSGRLRLLIRTCLNRKCLHVPVGYLVRTPFLALDYYSPNSILGDEILGEILYSVLLQISRLNFRLNLRNASFLDDTWDLPECCSLDFVPCKTLGLSVCFTRGKTLIIKIKKHSVAAEDERIEVGDVLDEINGNIISIQTRANLHKIMKKTACLPISVHIVKYRNSKTKETFAPIVNVIKSSGLDHMKQLLRSPALEFMKPLETQQPSSPQKEDKTLQEGKPGCLFDYCGSICVGREGDVKQIEKGIRRLLHIGNIKYIPIRFECLEIGVKITQNFDNKVIFDYSYMEISSCGHSVNFPHYFAFISGETNCSIATNFEAHIFYHKNETEVQTILQSLGQGFYRTHFAV
ncbi:uncharacterized protein LOC131663816 isoform X2 [Phymastichus coffea]|nr:uncharacterized protein LOC131663816 isoform X2 [Phymastichus coffea]